MQPLLLRSCKAHENHKVVQVRTSFDPGFEDPSLRAVTYKVRDRQDLKRRDKKKYTDMRRHGMDNENLTLRYYEIIFQQYIMNLYTQHSMDRAQVFMQASLDMMPTVTDSLVLGAVRRILSLDSTLRIFKPEHMIVLNKVEGLSKAQIRKRLKCSPNVVLQAFQDYESDNLHVQPRFDIMTSRHIQDYMNNIKGLLNL